MGSFETDIILACEYAKLLILNNDGIETIAYELSKRKLGAVSKLFKKIIADEKRGIPVEKSIEMMSENKNTDERMKLLLTSIQSGKSSFARMSDIGKDIVNQNEIAVKKQIDRIELLSGWLVIVALLPIVIVIIDLFNLTMGNGPATEIVNFRSIIIPEAIKPGILAVGTIIIFTAIAILGISKK